MSAVEALILLRRARTYKSRRVDERVCSRGPLPFDAAFVLGIGRRQWATPRSSGYPMNVESYLTYTPTSRSDRPFRKSDWPQKASISNSRSIKFSAIPPQDDLAGRIGGESLAPSSIGLTVNCISCSISANFSVATKPLVALTTS
jgi:hypothetical protein